MISIIIPFHKGQSYLEDCFQSLLEQTYQEFEIILICDHISEEIDSLIYNYQKALMIQVHYLSEKQGVAAARNFGIKCASGDYIYFLDSDDYLPVDTLGIFAEAAGTADIIYGPIEKTWFTRNTYLSGITNNTEDENSECTDDSIQMVPDSIDGEEEWIAKDNGHNGQLEAIHYLVEKKKDLKDISILNTMIKHSFITELQLYFHEDIIYLSDYPFLLQVLKYAGECHFLKNAIYIKRKHNDPINHPSMHQIYANKDYNDYIKAYQYTAGLLDMDSQLHTILDKKVLYYYIHNFAPKLHRDQNKRELSKVFMKLHVLIQSMNSDILFGYTGYKRKLLFALYSGDRKRSLRLVRNHLAWGKIKKMVKKRKELSKTLYFHIFLNMKIQMNLVLCESFFGKSYSDNPKYIYEYLSRYYPGRYKFVWVIENKKTHIPYKHIKVKRYGILYYYYLARSKYYIFNGRQPEWTRKRKGNIFLQTWHGTPLKHLAFDLVDISSASAKYKKQVFNQSRDWDYLIAPNLYSSEIFKRCFMYDKEILETGYPRNDILHKPDRMCRSKKIKKALKLPLQKKVILYAPTWRDDEYYSKGKYKFKLQLDIHRLKERFGEDYVLLLRTHYFIADTIPMTGLRDFAFNVSRYDDIAELYLISDILITDYSSVFFDYANLRRPMIFYMYDLDKYRDILRGFYINIEEELPGPIVTTTEEVADAIAGIQAFEQAYREKYDRFYNKYCLWENGNATKKVVERVFAQALPKE